MARRSLRGDAARAARCAALAAAASGYPRRSRPGRALAFPRDHGAHPEFRTEWWYVTGWLQERRRQRARHPDHVLSQPTAACGEANPSRFAPRQLLFAHAALADPSTGTAAARPARRARRLRSGRGARGRHRRAGSTTGRCGSTASGYRARIAARELRARLSNSRRPQPLLLQGERASAARARIRRRRATTTAAAARGVRNRHRSGASKRERSAARAWLDHEWSSEYLAPEARGLGLDRPQSRRRRRADGVSDARPAGRRLLGRRRAARRRRARARLRAGRSALRTRAPLALAAHRRRVPGGDAAARRGARARTRAAAWTTRNSTRARAPAPSTGKARCARARQASAVGPRLPGTHRLLEAAEDVSARRSLGLACTAWFNMVRPSNRALKSMLTRAWCRVQSAACN